MVWINDLKYMFPSLCCILTLTLTNSSLAAKGTHGSLHGMNETSFKLSVDVSKRAEWEGITQAKRHLLQLGQLELFPGRFVQGVG